MTADMHRSRPSSGRQEEVDVRSLRCPVEIERDAVDAAPVPISHNGLTGFVTD